MFHRLLARCFTHIKGIVHLNTHLATNIERLYQGCQPSQFLWKPPDFEANIMTVRFNNILTAQFFVSNWDAASGLLKWHAYWSWRNRLVF